MLNLHALRQYFYALHRITAFFDAVTHHFPAFFHVFMQYYISKSSLYICKTAKLTYKLHRTVSGDYCCPGLSPVTIAAAFMRRIPCAIDSSAWDSYFLLNMLTSLITDDSLRHRRKHSESAFWPRNSPCEARLL